MKFRTKLLIEKLWKDICIFSYTEIPKWKLCFNIVFIEMDVFDFWWKTDSSVKMC